MFQAMYLKSETKEDSSRVHAQAIKVEAVECYQSNGSLSQPNNVVVNKVRRDSPVINTEEIGETRNMAVTDYDELVKEENRSDVQEIIIKEEFFEDAHIKSENICGNSVNKKLYICRFCEYETLNQNTMLEHVQIHCDKPCAAESDGSKPHIDDDCGNSCVSKGSEKRTLVGNVRSLASKIPYLCAHCDFRTKRKVHLVNHLRKHTAEKSKPYVCKHCGYITRNKSNFTVHSWRHTDKQPFACKYCNYKCSQSSHLKRHERIHTGEKPFACHFCSYRAKDKSNLATHIKLHTDEKPHACKYCNYRSITKGNLIIHMRQHTGEKPYECDECGYRTTTKVKLINHISKHEWQYRCDRCDFKCSNKSYLNTHNRLHNGKKLYACTDCSYITNYNTNLFRHYHRKHTIVKSIACMSCDYGKSDKSGSTSHCARHKYEKLYACHQCDYTTNDSCCLIVHNKQHSEVEPQIQVKTYARTYSRICEGEKPLVCSSCDYRCLYASTLAHHERTHTVTAVTTGELSNRI